MAHQVLVFEIIESKFFIIFLPIFPSHMIFRVTNRILMGLTKIYRERSYNKMENVK
jgi:hypothetical protein